MRRGERRVFGRSSVLVILGLAAVFVVAAGLDHQRELGPAKNLTRDWVIAFEAKRTRMHDAGRLR